MSHTAFICGADVIKVKRQKELGAVGAQLFLSATIHE